MITEILDYTKEKPTENDRVIKLKKYQDDFIFSEVRYPALISAWGTGKTMCAIERCVIHSEKYKDNLGVIFRKEYTDLRDSTIKDFEQNTGMKVNSSREVRFPNGSVIMFRHMEEVNNLQNINLGFFLIEQAEELDNDENFFFLQGRLRRRGVPHWGGIIGNANGHKWIYKLWKTKTLENAELFEANTFENADNLPKDYIESLKIIEKQKPSVYRRCVLNSWDESDTQDLVIMPEWIESARMRKLTVYEPLIGVISIDVGYGRDKTVMYAIVNNVQKGKLELDLRDTMQLVGHAQLFANRFGIKVFAVDEIGVGAGVKDRLKELNFEVIEVNSATKSRYEEKYSNTRSEIYGYASDMFQKCGVQIDPEDKDLIEQLSWTKFKAVRSSGMVEIESKDLVKKRYGRSPDNADAFLNGLWALQFVKTSVNGDKLRRVQGYIPEKWRAA